MLANLQWLLPFSPWSSLKLVLAVWMLRVKQIVGKVVVIRYRNNVRIQHWLWCRWQLKVYWGDKLLVWMHLVSKKCEGWTWYHHSQGHLGHATHLALIAFTSEAVWLLPSCPLRCLQYRTPIHLKALCCFPYFLHLPHNTNFLLLLRFQGPHHRQLHRLCLLLPIFFLFC